jgi:hypothetical protein
MQNAEETSPQIEAERLNKLRTQVQLEEITEGMKEAETTVSELPEKLTAIRNGGYMFKNDLEDKIIGLGQRWRVMEPRLRAEHFRRRDELNTEVSRMQSIINGGGSAGSVLDALQSKVDLAKQNLEALLKPIINDAQELKSQLTHIEWVLQQISQATFRLLADEALLEAVQANWKKPDDKDGMDGVLYLTDQRLVFEQKEEIATKKVLFIATAKQKVQALQWGIPVQNVTSAAGSKRGFLNKDDFLSITCTGGAVFSSTDLHLKGHTGESWRLMIDRVKSGAIDKERLGNEAESEERSMGWGTTQPIMLRNPGGSVMGVRVAGNCTLLINNPDAYTKQGGDAFVKSVLQQKLTEYLGEAMGSGRTVRDVENSLELIGPALLPDVQTAIDAFGGVIKDIQVDSVQVSDQSRE